MHLIFGNGVNSEAARGWKRRVERISPSVLRSQGSRIIAKMGIPSDHIKKPGSRGCVGKKYTSDNFRSGTPARRQTKLLENCVYRGQGEVLIESLTQ